MPNQSAPLVLGSRSPRRLELLRQVVPAERIVTLPPRSAEELGFDGLTNHLAIFRRLQEIARTKADDVLDQLRDQGQQFAAVICADTTILASDENGTPIVLGQPPASDGWKDLVRGWFRDYYAGKQHQVLTGLCVTTPAGERIERIVTTSVKFRADVEPWLEWYLSIGESIGKAGGYALQGAGSIFITQVIGSLSNVIGLPLEDLLEVFGELNINVGRG